MNDDLDLAGSLAGESLALYKQADRYAAAGKPVAALAATDQADAARARYLAVRDSSADPLLSGLREDAL